MKRTLSLLACIATSFSFGQTYNAFYGGLANSCNQDTVNQYLIEYENLGVKELGTTALDNAYDWLEAKYIQYGYTDLQEDNFIAGGPQAKNLIVTKTGTVYPNTYVIIDAHYDTKNGTGTNDNGSGTAILLELARLLKDVEFEYSIKFIHFSAEENGLIGSQHYVNDDVIPTNMDIKLVFNIDQVGGVAGMTNDIIVCEQDMSPPSGNDAQSAVMTNELATCIGLYSTLNTEISWAYASDYVPFMNNGEIVTGLYEKNESPYSHTAQDSIGYMDVDYLFQITKGTMGALAHFAVAYEVIGIDEIDYAALNIFPTPSNGNLTLVSEQLVGNQAEIEVYDLTGKVVWNTALTITGKDQIDLNTLNSGTYFLSMSSNGKVYRRKVILQ